MQKKEVFMADDGQVFDSENDCLMYEAKRREVTDVDAYLDHKATLQEKPLSARARSRQRNVILDFLGWWVRREGIDGDDV